MTENENVTPIVPDYMTNNKVYGKSILEYVPEKNDSTIENEFFNNNEYDTNDINTKRDELREGYNGEHIKENISVDALSGVKTSTPVKDVSMHELINDMEKDMEDIKGKKITNYGRNLIKSLIGEYPTEEEESQISKAFEDNRDIITDKNNFSSIATDKLEGFLSQRIIDQIKAISSDEEYHDVLVRFLQQIFIPYNSSVKIRDDISDLNNIAKYLDDKGAFSSDENFDKKYDSDSLVEISNKISEFIECTKKLDDRNKRLKQDYTIDDIDTKLVKEIGDCLNNAINFESVIKKVDSATNKFIKDLKKVGDVNNSIDNWIHSIKHDPHTLFTFPCNDFLTDEESRKELLKFFYNTYLANIAFESNLIIPDDEDLEEYLLKNNYLNNEKISMFKDMAWVMLYILSRTFKYNKVKDNEYETRILSYTLDLISKMGIASHRKKFIEISEYVYSKLR